MFFTKGNKPTSSFIRPTMTILFFRQDEQEQHPQADDPQGNHPKGHLSTGHYSQVA